MKTLPSHGVGPTHGYLYIHSAPKAVLKNLEWSLAEALQLPISLAWEPQPLASSSYRCQISWNGLVGTSARIVSALKGWHYITFELFESPVNGSDGSLYMFTPELGLFRGTVGAHGDLMINENQLHKLINDNLRADVVIEAIENLLGKKWDNAIDLYRNSTFGENQDARLSV